MRKATIGANIRRLHVNARELKLTNGGMLKHSASSTTFKLDMKIAEKTCVVTKVVHEEGESKSKGNGCVALVSEVTKMLSCDGDSECLGDDVHKDSPPANVNLVIKLGTADVDR